MSCLAKVILITDAANALTTHLDEFSFQRLPVRGEFIYKYDGMAQPAETVYQVVAVLHDVSGHGVTLPAQVYVRASSSPDFRSLLQNVG